MSFRLRPAGLLLVIALLGSEARCWDYAGHRLVNQAALASLPAEFPSFVRTPEAAERIAFLAGEPDRWRNVTDLPVKHATGPDHYIDLEKLALAGLNSRTVPALRFEFALAFAAGRAEHAANFAPIDPAKNADRTSEWPGFAPWAVAEYYGKLKSAFSYLKVYEELGTADEIANARANIVYVMGVMGHIVGDLAQPLHTTVHHHGWSGPNPRGYTAQRAIHSWIDGGLIAAAAIVPNDVLRRIHPARTLPAMPANDGRDPVFVAVMDYALAQNAQVEPLYALEKAGKLAAEPAAHAEGREFLCEQLRRGGEMLGSLWRTAWENTVPDVYLREQLLKRRPAVASAGQ